MSNINNLTFVTLETKYNRPLSKIIHHLWWANAVWFVSYSSSNLHRFAVCLLAYAVEFLFLGDVCSNYQWRHKARLLFIVLSAKVMKIAFIDVISSNNDIFSKLQHLKKYFRSFLFFQIDFAIWGVFNIFLKKVMIRKVFSKIL